MNATSSIYGSLAVLSGSGNPALAQVIAAELGTELRPVKITVFSNENIFMQLEESVRSQDVFIIQPTCSPVSYNIMELLIMIDTVKREKRPAARTDYSPFGSGPAHHSRG